MIIECPSCLTRYDTPAQIPEEGRNVRCAKCEHVWLVSPDDKPIDPDPATHSDEQSGAPEPDLSEEEAAAAAAAETSEPTVDEDALETAEAADAETSEPTVDEDTLEAAEAADADTQEPTVDEDTLEAADAADSVGDLDDEDPLSSEDIDWGDDDEPAEAEAVASEQQPEPEPEPEVKAEPEPEPEPEAKAEPEEIFASEPTADDDADATPVEDADAETAADDDVAGDAEGVDVPPIVIPEEQPAPRMDTMLMAGWAGLALFVVLVMTLLVTQRVGIVSALPGAASAYNSIGLPVNVRGLDFDKVTSTWTVEAGRSILEIHGDIVNVTDADVSVPTVVFALRNAKGLEVYQWAAEVRNEPLAGGERTPFVARIPTPPKSIKNVQVKFARAR